jgi:flagellar biosynthesis/type III secretory pathway chaperone
MKTKKLADILEVQLKLLEELLANMERETPELADINLDVLSEINSLKENVAARLDEQTVPLRKTIAEVAVSLALPAGAPLGDVAEQLGKQGNREIPRMHQDLNRLAERVRQVAMLNRDVAERFLMSVTNSLNFLTHMLNQSTVYSASGGYSRQQSGAFMINREA